MPLLGALWSPGHAAQTWVKALELGAREGAVLLHAQRGRQRVEDVARNNAHDAYDHAWDISRP